MRLALALVLLLTSTVFAGEEPKGFAEFPWGTHRDVLIEKFFKPHCSGLLPRETKPTSIVCLNYRIGSIYGATVTLSLLESNDSLSGYLILLESKHYEDFKAATLEKFGQPKADAGRSAGWEWGSGTIATLHRNCPLHPSLAAETCLTVATKAALAKSGAESQERRNEIKKGF